MSPYRAAVGMVCEIFSRKNLKLDTPWQNWIFLFFFNVQNSVCFFLIMSRCCQYNFSGIFKGRQIIPEPYRNSKCPIKPLLWWHKTLLDAIWTQAYSNLLKHLRWSLFVQKINGLKLLTGHAKTFHLRCLKGSWWICFCWKARQV